MGNQTFWQFDIEIMRRGLASRWSGKRRDVFSDHVEDRSVPEFVKVFMLFLTVTKSRHIVEKGINPYIDNVSRLMELELPK